VKQFALEALLPVKIAAIIIKTERTNKMPDAL
jgi:hypothetical protein